MSTLVTDLATVGEYNGVVSTDHDYGCNSGRSIGCAFVSLKFSSNDLAGTRYLRVSWIYSLPSAIKTGSCGRKCKEPGNEVYKMEKLANFLIGILYWCCMDLVWKLNINFSKHGNNTSFQTWILSSYQFGFSKIWARTSYLEINKSLFWFFDNRSTFSFS